MSPPSAIVCCSTQVVFPFPGAHIRRFLGTPHRNPDVSGYIARASTHSPFHPRSDVFWLLVVTVRLSRTTLHLGPTGRFDIPDLDICLWDLHQDDVRTPSVRLSGPNVCPELRTPHRSHAHRANLEQYLHLALLDKEQVSLFVRSRSPSLPMAYAVQRRCRSPGLQVRHRKSFLLSISAHHPRLCVSRPNGALARVRAFTRIEVFTG